MNIFVSSKASSPRTAIVTSQTNPLPATFPELMAGDTIPVNIYIVDGVGGYEACSGGAGYSLAVAIGTPGSTPLWASVDYDAITNGFEGVISTNTQDILNLFDSGSNPAETTLEIQVIDSTSRARTYASIPLKIRRQVITETGETATIPPITTSNIFSSSADPNGVISATGPALCWGTGAVAGAVWSKTSIGTSNDEWIQIIAPRA